MNYPANYIEIPQRIDDAANPDWLRMRSGLVTGSKAYDVVTKRKRVKEGTEPAPLQAYLDCLSDTVFEVATGLTAEKYVSYWMKRGIEFEEFARTAYEMDYGAEVDARIGFILHPCIPMCGMSPDGLVDDDGGLELKVPAPGTHWKYLMAGVMPEEYIPQVQLSMACSGRQWWDFMSYCPDMPRKYQNFKIRVERDDAYIGQMELDIEKFLAEVDAAVKRLESGGDLVPILEKSIAMVQGR